jgi:methionine-rich copper-binding protein CopC
MKSANLFAGLIGVLAFAASQAVWAHAFLDHADPRVGTSSEKAPERVTLWFTERLEPAFSWVKVYDASGKQVDRRDKAFDGRDASVMHVSIPALAPGKYRVAWRAVSIDTHVTEGDYTFEVKD